MVGELIIFPARVGVRAARSAVRTGVHATGRALSLAAYVVRSVAPDGAADAPERTEPYAATPVARPPIETAPPPPPVDAGASPVAPVESTDVPAPETPPLRAEPVHVSEEPTVVEEFAEPGAEEGAGAEVTVAEPWEGFARMTAKDVIARLADASPAELAAVQLYEHATRQRETVTAAAARELRTKTARAAARAYQTTKEQEHPDG
jgi:hypothetical protein